MSLACDLALLVDAARRAGAIAMPYFEGRRALDVRDKGKNDPVTAADLAVDAFLKETLLSARPDHGWLSEESADDRSRLTAGRVFIVDPIDGTRAFVKGRPHFAVSAALVEAGRPVAGVVFNPAEDELYEAASGGGARLNGQALRPKAPDGLDSLRLLTGDDVIGAKGWTRPWPDGVTTGHVNSVAYRVCLAASGRWDAVLAPGGKSDWDIAACDLIAQEAGLRLTDLDGAAYRYNQEGTRHDGLICAAPDIHDAIARRVREARQAQ